MCVCLLLVTCDCTHGRQCLEHTADMHYYVQPLVVEEVPGGMTTGELVTKLNGGEAVNGVTPATLGDEGAAFLASDDSLLVLLGEAGSGKSMFTWLTVKKCLDEVDVLAQGVRAIGSRRSGTGSGTGSGSGSGSTSSASGNATAILWVPVVIDLKQYKVSELSGLVPRYLRDACGMSDDDVCVLRHGSSPSPLLPRIGVVVVCDGFDELQAEESDRDTKAARGRLREFYNLVTDKQHGHWAVGTLKVVVTTRESRLNGRGDENAVFGKHRRRVLLPFNDAQVPWAMMQLSSWTLRCASTTATETLACIPVSVRRV